MACQLSSEHRKSPSALKLFVVSLHLFLVASTLLFVENVKNRVIFKGVKLTDRIGKVIMLIFSAALYQLYL